MEKRELPEDGKRISALRPSLLLYDTLIFAVLALLFLWINRENSGPGIRAYLIICAVCYVVIVLARKLGRIYNQIWRYGGVQCYIRLLAADAAGAFVLCVLSRLPGMETRLVLVIAFCCMNTLGALTMRLCYRYAYKCGGQVTFQGRVLRWMLKVFSGGRVSAVPDRSSQRIRVAILGAGTEGIALADELMKNADSMYIPRCFIDNAPEKIGRVVHGLAVMPEQDSTLEELREFHIQEIVFAVPSMERSRRMELYEYYRSAGFGVRVYEYAKIELPGGKRQMREIRIEDLLTREEKELLDADTCAYYRDKVILITGGGGSIGSEMCRQLAKMEPRQLIIADLYENNAYDLQQDLKFAYKGKLDVRVEIVNVCSEQSLANVFREYSPQICIHAAAHKHVPLMEKNSCEAVDNNVFGTLNVVRACEKYGCGRFIMVSTDKAVNPANIMGATKRMGEMIMQAYSTRGKVLCSATRFGNVLGSAGSVIPLFQRQIAGGGPVTVTDKRIIRYFMTIPEASQLVLVSGAMAKNGDLFVLDMGKPVKIYDLAVNMIRMSGATGIEILETGLRPGEKLYEELLVDREGLERTPNHQIFIEHEHPVTMEELEKKLDILRAAIAANDNEGCREAMKKVVPTYHCPDRAGASSEQVNEIKSVEDKRS